MTFEAGTQLGHYRILSLLGRGGMADVYRAEDERLGREVALKALPPEFARDPERVRRFEREVCAAARLNHSNIVTVYEYGHGAGQHFYTMALMAGGDLKARIREHPEGMPPTEALAIAAAVAKALDYAHGRGYVHRDVKPENILFGEDGAPALTDFGIARAMSDGTRMTATGMSIGSPHYMSPEQARGLVVDGRSDLYSLGVVLYEMLTGRAPVDADETLAVALSHLNDPVPPLAAALAAYQPLMDRLLAKSPDGRYESGQQVAAALDALARGEAAPLLVGDDAPQSPSSALSSSPTADAAPQATRVMESAPQSPAARDLSGRRQFRAVAAGMALAAVVLFGFLLLDGETSSRTVGAGEDGAPTAPVESFRDCANCPEMVVIPAGRFRMGCVSGWPWRRVGTSGCEDREKPVHEVRIVRPFALAKHEVTRGDFRRFVDATGHSMGDSCTIRIGRGYGPRRGRGWLSPGFDQTDRDPVVCVSWRDAQAYAGWLSRETGESYRLPSESEWEYAARAGSATNYGWGDGILLIFVGEAVVLGRNRANCDGCGSRWDDERTAPVGSFASNAWGLFDMHGNVSEWVEDCLNWSYRGAPTDGSAWASGMCHRRVQRGGSWYSSPGGLRSAIRRESSVGRRAFYSGFRVARTLTSRAFTPIHPSELPLPALF